jgi:hypothetical protein
MENNQTVVLNATDLQWLDVTYTAKKYLTEQQTTAKPRKNLVKKTIKNALVFGAMGVACLAVLLTFTFVKANFDGNFLQVAKATFTSSVLGNNAQQTTTLTVPCNMQVDSVSNGVVVLSGGKALTSLTNGTVVSNDANGLAVQVDDNLVVVYTGLTQCFVSVGDVVSNNQLLGKYEGSVSASAIYNGQPVVDVVASPSAIKWSI